MPDSRSGVADMEQHMMASDAMPERARDDVTAKPRPVPVPLGEGIILVDSNSTVVAMDAGAEAIIRDLRKGLDSSGRDHELPRQIRSYLESRSGDDWCGMELTLSTGGHEYSCRAFIVKAEDGISAPVVALHLRREVLLVDAVHQIASEYHLTDREQQALVGIARGLSSKEVAAQMKISPNTVKAFLRLIMIKMGIANRAGLVAKLLDQNGLRAGPDRTGDLR